MRPTLFAAALFTLVACGKDDTDDTEELEDTLTCDYLASDDNCWTTTAEAGGECVDSEEEGVFNADLSQCTFTDGTVIDFGGPLPLAEGLPDEYLFHITVTAPSGSTCLEYVEAEMGATLTVQGEVVDVAYSGFQTMDMTCPDGEGVHTGSVWDLLDCEAGMFGLPGHSWSESPTSLWFGLLGPEDAFHFTCAVAD